MTLAKHVNRATTVELITFVKDDTWEQEDNNTKDGANLITPNTMYKGAMGSEDDVDFYKFTVTETGDATITLAPDPEMSNSNDISFTLCIQNYGGFDKYNNYKIKYLLISTQFHFGSISGEINRKKYVYIIRIFSFWRYFRLSPKIKR